MPSEEFNRILEALFQKGDQFKRDLQDNLKEFSINLAKSSDLDDPNLMLTVLDEDEPLVEIEINLVPENNTHKLEVFMTSGFEEDPEGAIEISKMFDINNLDNTWAELIDWIFENLEESED